MSAILVLLGQWEWSGILADEVGVNVVLRNREALDYPECWVGDCRQRRVGCGQVLSCRYCDRRGRPITEQTVPVEVQLLSLPLGGLHRLIIAATVVIERHREARG